MKEAVDIYKLLRKHSFCGDYTRGLETETPMWPSEMQGCFISLLQQEPSACFMPVHSAATGNGILILQERSEFDFCVVLSSCRKKKGAIVHHFHIRFSKLKVLH